MKKVLFLMLILSACTSQRTNGIYQTCDGWDIVENGKTYQYRCEPDGLYLYIDWDGANSYGIMFEHNDNERTFARLYFFDRSLELLDTWEWKMNNDSECQGVTPIAQKDKIILVVPAWWRYVSGQTYFYRLQYIV